MRDSDLGHGLSAPFLTVGFVAAIPYLVEAIAAEGYDVKIVAPKSACQAFGLASSVRLALIELLAAKQDLTIVDATVAGEDAQ